MIFEIILLIAFAVLFKKLTGKLRLPRIIGIDLYLICAVIGGYYISFQAGFLIGLLAPIIAALLSKSPKISINPLVIGLMVGIVGALASIIPLSFLIVGITLTLVYSLITYLLYHKILKQNPAIFCITYIVSNLLFFWVAHSFIQKGVWW